MTKCNIDITSSPGSAAATKHREIHSFPLSSSHFIVHSAAAWDTIFFHVAYVVRFTSMMTPYHLPYQMGILRSAPISNGNPPILNRVIRYQMGVLWYQMGMLWYKEAIPINSVQMYMFFTPGILLCLPWHPIKYTWGRSTTWTLLETTGIKMAIIIVALIQRIIWHRRLDIGTLQRILIWYILL